MDTRTHTHNSMSVPIVAGNVACGCVACHHRDRVSKSARDVFVHTSDRALQIKRLRGCVADENRRVQRAASDEPAWTYAHVYITWREVTNLTLNLLSPTLTPASPTLIPAAPTLGTAAPTLIPAAPTLIPTATHGPAATLGPASPTLGPAAPTLGPAAPESDGPAVGCKAATGDEAALQPAAWQPAKVDPPRTPYMVLGNHLVFQPGEIAGAVEMHAFALVPATLVLQLSIQALASLPVAALLAHQPWPDAPAKLVVSVLGAAGARDLVLRLTKRDGSDMRDGSAKRADSTLLVSELLLTCKRTPTAADVPPRSSLQPHAVAVVGTTVAVVYGPPIGMGLCRELDWYTLAEHALNAPR